ncbi:dual specificity tyrosine-phosphorylation-regulated kinase 4-like [Lethenteron reissneri]|uniref:dual specificity tyrosine-phosphorylation-regulated kinase 4-like n=1 Tax=Lethenteron reissneri TaxID=7753 RepID=UPI002AB6BE96|nr:dual specificity tyrosine-phosphorylation-regulated kinase 4-like [Lethenteron reissneri]
MKMYGPRINKRERKELSACKEIWYYSATPRRMGRGKVTCYGADGHYIPVWHEHLLYRYEVLDVLGQGSFGKVLKCLDHKSKEFVAVKVLNRARFNESVHRREIEILKRLQTARESSKIIRMMEHFSFRGRECVVFELLNGNLRSQLKLTHRQGFVLETVRLFAISLLKSLQQLRDVNVIHGDLKPGNIGICSYEAGEVKLFDFGCSCFDHEEHFTKIQTRHYRAPEVILDLGYSFPADMWSLGCTLAELHSGQTLFPGHTNEDQLHSIMEVFGLPPQNMIEESSVQLEFFDDSGRAQLHRRLVRAPGSRALPLALGTTDELFIDFIRSCLQWDPEWRLTPHGAMDHEWVRAPRMPPAQSAAPDLDDEEGPGPPSGNTCGSAAPLRDAKDPGAALHVHPDATLASSDNQGIASPSHDNWADQVIEEALVFALGRKRDTAGTLLIQEDLTTARSAQQCPALASCTRQEADGTSQSHECLVTSSVAQRDPNPPCGPKAEAAEASTNGGNLTMTPVDPSPAAASDCNRSLATDSCNKQQQAARTPRETIRAADREDAGHAKALPAEEVVQAASHRHNNPSQRFLFANKRLRPFFRRLLHCHSCCGGGGEVGY